MAEKPRLKDTDEIMNSIGKRKGRRNPAIPEGDRLPPSAVESTPSRRRKQPLSDAEVAASLDAPSDEDHRPLDFGKYELPAKPTKKAAVKSGAAAPKASPSPTPKVPARAVKADPQPLAAGPDTNVDTPPRESAVPPPAAILWGPEGEQSGVTAYQFEDLTALQRREEQEAAAQKRHAQQDEEAHTAELEAQARRKMLEDDSYRQGVFQHLGTEFEDAFSQEFSGKPAADAPPVKPSWLERRSKDRKAEAPPEKPFIAPPPADQKPELPAVFEPVGTGLPEDSDEAATLEADQFLQQFRQDVREEESPRVEDFKETLAQKFMRERERYLKELGIEEQMEAQQEAEAARQERPPASPEPSRRRLDLAIQPEMHRSPGDASPRPVTYNRSARVEPQAPAEGTPVFVPFQVPDLPDSFQASGAPQPAANSALGGKKTTEQLLAELAVQNTQRARKRPATPEQPAQLHFRFAPVEEPGEAAAEQKPKKKIKPPVSPRTQLMRRVMALSAAAGTLLLALVVIGILSVLGPEKVIGADAEISAGDSTHDQLTAYDNYTADRQAAYNNVVVKRTGITLGNLTVREKLVVEEEASAQGSLTLSNVLVGELIYVKTSGINLLDLRDVQADRLVINNDRAAVTVRTSGATDIGTLELRTEAVIDQGLLTGEAPGVRNVAVRSPDGAGKPLSFTAKNASLQYLSSLGETAMLFENAEVETMSTDGSLALTGSGRVQNLSAGVGAGGGAADPMAPAALNLLIKGVEIGRLDLKSPTSLNLSSQVDSLYASDPLTLSGNGVVGSLTLNDKFGNGRLAVDISGLTVQQLTANTEAVIYSNGSSTINTLTANQSTYALGNKVNLLVANMSGVIYEREPDSRKVAAGVEQPQSKAENPNLNYSLSIAENTAPTDTSGDPIATTCDHARELGGFLQGDGSASSPFMVETAAQLAHVSEHPSSHYIQGGDIDIAADSSFAGGFKMIGAGGTRFSGVYDGRGYAIRNLRVISDAEYVGLFAENTGVIRNVHLQSGEILGGDKAFVGGIAGFNYQGGQVVSCSNGASVNAASSAYAGGIVGYNYGGKVRDCYNTAKITGGDYSGGLVGMNRQSASVTGSYNVGVVEGETTVGAITGSNEDAVVTNCYFLEGTADEGIGAGGGNTVSMTTEQLSAAQTVADLAAGDDASLWQQSADSGYIYPTLKTPSHAAPAA